MANHNNDAELVDEKHALTLFFTSLLSDTEEPVTTELKIEKSLERNEFKANSDTDTKVDNAVFLPVIPVQILEDTTVQSEPEIIETVEQKNTIIKETSDELEITSIKTESRVVDKAFQILMFKTAGLTLAVPLVELSGVISWPENITEMPGHKDSYLGIVQHLGKKVPIIDIAQIVFPQDRIASLINSDTHERLQRIVFINNFEWGLACDAVYDVITIDSEQIKWRKIGTKRAWLAGTVVKHMCALLDIKELSKLLNSDHS